MTSVAGLSILLVEDEYLIALDAEQMLLDLGAGSIEIVSGFEEALARAGEGAFDIVVLDVNINGQFSFPIADELYRRSIPVVFATGYGLQDRPLSDFHGSVCVSKPYTLDRLGQALSVALTDERRAAVAASTTPAEKSLSL